MVQRTHRQKNNFFAVLKSIILLKTQAANASVYADAAEPSRRITRATSSEKKYKFTPFR